MDNDLGEELMNYAANYAISYTVQELGNYVDKLNKEFPVDGILSFPSLKKFTLEAGHVEFELATKSKWLL